MPNDSPMNKPLDGAGLSIVNAIMNDRLSKKADVSDLPTKTSDLNNDSGFITESDIPEWARQPEKPNYSPIEVGAIPLVMADTFAKKTDITGVYKYRGSVATYDDLPTDNLIAGDVYNVEANDMNYGWTGSAWDPLGQIFTIEYLSTEEVEDIMNE